MKDGKYYVHLGVYSDAAFHLLKLYGDEDKFFNNFRDDDEHQSFIRAPDNEIIYVSDKPATYRKVTESLAYKCPPTSMFARDVIALIQAIRHDQQLSEDSRRLIGKPLNPIDTSTIEVLEKEIEITKTYFTDQIKQLERLRDEKVINLKTLIEEVRKKQCSFL